MTALPIVLASLSILAPRQDASVAAPQEPLRLAWAGETNAVYLLSVRLRDEPEQLFAVSNRTDAWIANLELGGRYLWSVRTAGSLDGVEASFTTAFCPPRLLRGHGLRDFRDLGGWRTVGGRRVRQNRLLRATVVGETVRTELSVRREIDLRSAPETFQRRASLFGDDVRWKNLTLEPGRKIDGVVGGRETFAGIFTALADEESYPIVFTGDTSRTATLAFLLNGLLGVGEDDLRRDWNGSEALWKELTGFLATLPGKTLAERLESYARTCAVSADEIAAFRAHMLEDDEKAVR